MGSDTLEEIEVINLEKKDVLKLKPKLKQMRQLRRVAVRGVGPHSGPRIPSTPSEDDSDYEWLEIENISFDGIKALLKTQGVNHWQKEVRLRLKEKEGGKYPWIHGGLRRLVAQGTQMRPIKTIKLLSNHKHTGEHCNQIENVNVICENSEGISMHKTNTRPGSTTRSRKRKVTS